MLCKVGINLLLVLQKIHMRGYVHRDINPDNILLGINDNWNEIHIIDYSLAKLISKNRIYYYNQQEKTGLIEFASAQSLMNNSFSFRDDLESLGYTLLFCYLRSLPWLKSLETDE